MVCKTKGNLKRPDGGGVFLKYLLWLWVWSHLTNWYSSTSDSSGMSVLITELIYWTKTSSVTTDIMGYIFNPEKICGYQVMATTSYFKFDSINEIFDLPMGCSWLLITYFIKASNLLSKWIAAIKESSHMLPRNEAFLAASWWSILSNEILSSGQCKSSAKL